MSLGGRGRGYLGRRHLTEPPRRPGDPPTPIAAASAPPPSEVDINNRLSDTPPMPTDTRGRQAAAAATGEPTLETDDEKALAELMLVEERYAPVVTLLEQFNPGEDGIVFNRKLREFEATLTSLCRDDTDLERAFSSLRGAALRDSTTARKLASVGASFTRQQRQNALRKALLNIMQSTFAKLDVLERSSPQILTNAATLMGDYFTEARLANGDKVHLLCSPLLQYMRSLLATNDSRAHRALATQLMQNGRELLVTSAQELDDISISIHQRLLAPSSSSQVWLLLSSDLCLNKFLPLSASLQAFYAKSLDLLPESEQTNNYKEVNYGSWKEQEKEKEPSDWSSNVSDLKDLSQDTQDSGRKPRPILGAGARQSNSDSSPRQESFSEDRVESERLRQGAEGMVYKSALAKRYDLNSWRQQENEEREQNQEDFTQDFVPFSDGDFQSYNFSQEAQYSGFVKPTVSQEGQYQGFSKPTVSQEGQYQENFTKPNFEKDAFSAPPPFPPPGDGKFTTPPPPFVPLDKAKPYSPPTESKFGKPPPYIDRPPLTPDGVFNTPPPPLPTERPGYTFNKERTVNQYTDRQEPFTNDERAANLFPVREQNQPVVQEGTNQPYEKNVAQKFSVQDRMSHLEIDERTANHLFPVRENANQQPVQAGTNQPYERSVAQKFSTQDQTKHPENKERVKERPTRERSSQFQERKVEKSNRDKTPDKATEKRQPPENWRKEKPKDDSRDSNRRKLDWSRQKSKDSDSAEDAEKSSAREDKGQRRNRNRSSRKSEDSDEAAKAAPQPVRRRAMDVPRSHKYWDHDDRLDKDY